MTEEAREWHNRNGVYGEYDLGVEARIVYSNAGGHEHEQPVEVRAQYCMLGVQTKSDNTIFEASSDRFLGQMVFGPYGGRLRARFFMFLRGRGSGGAC